MKWILQLLVGVSIMAMGLGSCSKRIDKPLPTPPFYQNNNPGSAGSIRLLHFSINGDYEYNPSGFNQAGSNLDVSINDKKLTNFVVFNSAIFSGGTAWFPAGTFNYGSSFTIPDSLFDPRGDASLKLFVLYKKAVTPIDAGNTINFVDSPVLKMDLSLHNNPAQPQDVILFDSLESVPAGQYIPPTTKMRVLTTARAQAPSRPDHFLIRLINVTGKPGNDPLNQLTLTYADGSAVDGKTTAVSYPAASDYVELPYGTYQFKVRDRSGNVIAEVNTLATGTDGKLLNTPLTYNTIRTYNPGGVYTILVHLHAFSGPVNYLPGYTVVTDVAPSTQPNYIRIQGIHVASGLSNIRFAIDGQSLGSFLNFGQQTGYGIFSIGPHKIQLLDGNGAELAVRVLNNTYPLDNLSIWAYAVNGQAQLLIVNNDMSQTAFSGGGLSVGLSPNGPQTSQFAWQCRFLNLSADVPYASFIDSIGFDVSTSSSNNPKAWEHLGIGVTFDEQGLVSMYAITDIIGRTITVYSSPPDELPGTPLNLVLHYPMVVNPQLYSGRLPSAEPGIYSIALIGSAAGTGDPLQVIKIKHNQ